ncbi:arginase family protein [Rubrivivax gelatinosus]|uniref:arginase family protein n=1 Tax=Rubrivivax gelatinosus TaxID=28068 RepID=UPI003D31727D
MTVRFHLAPYDAAARTGGPAQCQSGWRSALAGEFECETLAREHGPILPMLLARDVGRSLDARVVPITLGGDHSLSYFALREVTSRLGPVTVVHLDAHHDAYPAAVLNHYSVFSIASRHLPIRIAAAGYRHDCEPLPPVLLQRVSGPAYVSLDVDYFSPALVACVGDPIPVLPDRDCTLATFEQTLSMIDGPIVGADIVEWIGDDSGRQEIEFMSRVVRALVQRIGT